MRLTIDGSDTWLKRRGQCVLEGKVNMIVQLWFVASLLRAGADPVAVSCAPRCTHAISYHPYTFARTPSIRFTQDFIFISPEVMASCLQPFDYTTTPSSFNPLSV